MLQPLWLSIEPRQEETRLSLHEPGRGSVLRARMPLCPSQPRALATLLESLVAWYGRALVAVLDADAQDVRQHPERWARLLGELDEAHIAVQWTHRPSPQQRDRFLGRLGDFRASARLVGLAAGGGR
jgi:hypothetical protein